MYLQIALQTTSTPVPTGTQINLNVHMHKLFAPTCSQLPQTEIYRDTYIYTGGHVIMM